MVGFSSGSGASDPGPSDISAFALGGYNLGGFYAPLRLSSSARPITGSVVDLEVSNISPTAWAIVLRASFFQEAAGIDLASFGMPGCNAYVDLVSADSINWTVPTGRQLSFPFSCPFGFEGAPLYLQAGALDTMAPNSLGAVTSNGLAFRLGNL